MRYTTVVLGSALTGLCGAVVWSPQPTAPEANEPVATGWTPKPTNGPSLKKATLELSKFKDKRDVVPDNYCGFVGGYEDDPVTCNPGRTCYFYQFPASLSLWGMRGCCTATDSIHCGWALDCVESAFYSEDCDAACQNDAFTLKCTNAFSPYCHSFKYPSPGVLDYGCGAEPETGWQIVSTTYEGENAPSNSLNIASGSLSQNGPFSRASASGTATASGSKSSTTGGAIVSSPAPVSHHSSVPIAAIVGGVIGGLAVIGAIMAAIILCCLRSRSKKRRAQAGLAGPTAQPQAGTQYPPGQGPGGYHPVQQQGPSMQQSQQAAQQGGYFAPPVDKKQPDVQSRESESTAYYGAGGPSKQQFAERPFSAEIGGIQSPGSPLPLYNQGSYVHPQPTGDSTVSHQLHSDSSSVPPSSNYGSNVYEAPGH